MFFFYQFIITFLLLFSPLIFFYRIFKQKEDLNRFKEKYGIPSKKRGEGKLIWFHGASVGELLSIIPIIYTYEKNKNIKHILVTSSTLSSSKIIKKFSFKKTTHQFYPIDHTFINNKFLKYWKPNLAVFVESEIWPSMFKNLGKKKIPLVLLNARLTIKTFKRWMLISNFAQKIFNEIKIAFPQNHETKLFLQKLYKNKIKFIGNLKYIEKKNNNLNKLNYKLKLELKKKKLWIASSTHPNEEMFCAKAHMELKKRYKKLLTIIIPRHIHRTNEIIRGLKDLSLKVTTHSSNPKNLKDIDIYVVDTFGETEKFYKLSSSVFLGGSIIERGGQNPLEAARYGAKILHGPNIDNFKDVYRLLNSLNISKKNKVT